MKEILIWTKAIAWGLAVLLVAGAALVLARPLMILAIGAAVVAAVLYSISPRFAQWFDSLGQRPQSMVST